MTTSERLVRQLCDARIMAVQEERKIALTKVPDKIRWQDLPVYVRAEIVEYRRLVQRLESLKNRILAAGIHSYQLGKKLRSYDDNRQGARKQRIHDRHNDRLAKISQLKLTAATDLVGAEPKAAGAILRKLQAELAKV